MAAGSIPRRMMVHSMPPDMDAHRADVHIVVLNWNRCDDTLSCLASLSQSTYSHMHTWLVDQGSDDGSVEAVRRRFPDVEIVQTGGNTGFARGMNAGIRHALEAGAERILLLNNDTIASPTMLDRLVAQISPDVGIAGPAIFYADCPHQIWSAGGGVNRALCETTGNHSRGLPLPASATERAFLSGCAMLIPRQVFEQVGLFDERFFMYYEDLDLCLRIGSAGYRLLLVPDAHLWHRVSQSSGGPNTPAERYHMARSSGIFFRKHMHGWRTPLILPYRSLSAARWTGRLARLGNWRALAAYWRGLCHGWLAAGGSQP